MSETKSNRTKLPYWASQIVDGDKKHDRFVITGGLGCLRGDVRIQTINGLKRIDSLNHQELVLSYDHNLNQYCFAQASVAFPKGKGNLYRVVTQAGEFVANEEHRVFLTSGEYVKVELLSPNCSMRYYNAPLEKYSASCFLKSLLNDPHLMRKALNLICHYVVLARQYGQQLPFELGIGRDVFPLLDDALKSFHMFYPHVSFEVDVQEEQLQKHSHSDQCASLIYMRDYASQSLELAATLEDQDVALFFERALLASPECLQSLLMFFYHHKDQLISSCRTSSFLLQPLFDPSSSCVSDTSIISIEKLEDNSVYYDLTVERTGNYITEDGTIHHNSGKSTTGLMTFILKALNNPKVHMWWVVAPTHSRIDDSMIPAALFGLEMIGLKANIHYKLLRSKPQTIHILKTKQQIRFVSADKPEHMVSATLGGYFVTEAFRIKREVYENLESRTRSKFVDKTLGILEGTPEGDTWGKDEFNIDPRSPDPIRKLRRFILHTYDNEENLSPDYIPRLHQIYGHSPAMIRSYIYGEFSSFRLGDVFAQYLESRNVIPKIQADPLKPIALCFDFNATPLTWSAWQTVSYKIGHRVRIREVCIGESSLECRDLFSAAIEVGKMFDPDIFQHTRFELWGDRTGHAKSHKAAGSDYSNLKDYLSEVYSDVVIKAAREVTPIRASVDVVNRLLLYELALICDNCKNVRRSLNMTKWAAGKDDLEKKSGETHTHHGDGLRYRLWWLYKSVNIDDILDNQKIMGVNLA